MIDPINDASVREAVRCAANHLVDAFVGRANAPGGLQYARDEKSQADRQQRRRGQPGEHQDDETSAG